MNTSSNTQFARLCVCRAALAVGILWGFACGLLALVTMFTATYGHELVKVLGSIYPGYRPDTWLGVLLGLAWGFVDGLICGAVVAGLYNCMSKCGQCCWRQKPDQTCAPTQQ